MKEKLIRDELVYDIIKQGRGDRLRTAKPSEIKTFLYDKLKEEVQEVIDTKSKDELVEELADVLEVLDAILDYHEINKNQVKDTRRKKYNERGGFYKHMVLKVEEG